MAKVRLVFSTDVHGSEIYWRKWMKSAEHYNADTILMSGDLTGKAIVPIFKKEDQYTYTFLEKKHVIKNEENLTEASDELRLKGVYPFITTIEEVKELQKDKKKLDAKFSQLMVEGIERWMQQIEKYVDKKIQVIVNPGNDDILAIDPVIKKYDRVTYPLDKVVTIGDKYEMISCAWVNITPWNSPRECSEEELAKKLQREIDRLSEFKNALFNFHAPPINTHLDIAPAVDKSLKQKTTLGAPEMDHVGSSAVREAIEKKQPLLGLHGHIHESAGNHKIGETICINPGSKYTAGAFSAYIIDITEDGVKFWPASEI
jgi:Icc-related predicted phosphoesterase